MFGTYHSRIAFYICDMFHSSQSGTNCDRPFSTSVITGLGLYVPYTKCFSGFFPWNCVLALPIRNLYMPIEMCAKIGWFFSFTRNNGTLNQSERAHHTHHSFFSRKVHVLHLYPILYACAKETKIEYVSRHYSIDIAQEKAYMSE